MPTIQSPNLRKAVGDFIVQFITPEVSANAVLWGNQNNIALPADSNEYVIFYLQSAQRHGTNVNSYDADAESVQEDSEIEYSVQIDCYAGVDDANDGENAMLRAHSIEIMSKSMLACDFLEQYGLHVLYADPPSDTTIVDDDNNYIRRWTVQLHLAGHMNMTMDLEGFTDTKIRLNSLTTKDQAASQDPSENFLGVSNIDTYFKANGES